MAVTCCGCLECREWGALASLRQLLKLLVPEARHPASPKLFLTHAAPAPAVVPGSDIHLLRVCLRVGFDLKMAQLFVHNLQKVSRRMSKQTRVIDPFTLPDGSLSASSTSVLFALRKPLASTAPAAWRDWMQLLPGTPHPTCCLACLPGFHCCRLSRSWTGTRAPRCPHRARLMRGSRRRGAGSSSSARGHADFSKQRCCAAQVSRRRCSMVLCNPEFHQKTNRECVCVHVCKVVCRTAPVGHSCRDSKALISHGCA
jgi:hypothetical protein